MERNRALSHSHEPSYYEIALTNRQVLVVFVVLLICVVAAFFSGVWIGQRNDQTVIAETTDTVADGASTAAENGDAQVLNFFSDDGAASQPTLVQVVDQPTTETTLAEDVGVAEAEESTSAEQTPATESKMKADLEPTAASEPERIGERAKAEAATAPAKVGPSPTVAEGEHVIQVFSSADESQAKKLISQLSGGGFPAFLSPVDVGGQTMYRVRIGPYAELADAETVAARVRRSYKLDTWVTR